MYFKIRVSFSAGLPLFEDLIITFLFYRFQSYSRYNIYKKVEILNINNGERFSTYVILGQRGKRDICLNGAAARKVHKGDKIIIVAYATYDESELSNYKPKVVLVDDNNDIEEILEEI